MNDFKELKELKTKNLVEEINLKKYIEENRDRVNRYSINSGKVSYDLSQSRMINDVLGIAGNALSQVGTTIKETLIDNPITYNPNLSLEDSLLENHKKMVERDKEIAIVTKPFIEKARAYKEDIDAELGMETSSTQAFLAGMTIHTLRQGLDIRQYPGLYVSSLVGGGVGKVIGENLSFLAPGVAQRIGGAVGRFIEEFGEEITDQHSNGDELDLGTATMSGLGAVALGEGIIALKKGSGKISKLVGLTGTDIKANSNISPEKAVKESEMNYTKEMGNGEDITNKKINDLNNIAKNTEVHGVYKGKNIPAENVIKAGISIEGITVKTAEEEYLPKIAKHIIEKKMLKNVNNEVEFIELIKKDSKKVKEAFRKLGRKKDLPDDIKEAVEWYNKIFDEKRIKDVDVNTKSTIDATVGKLDNKQEYEPMFKNVKVIEKGYPFEEAEIGKEEYLRRTKDRIKHSYKDFKKAQLEEDLRKDLKIPKKAKLIKANGNIPKTPYKIKSNLDADGNPVYVRNKWEHGRPVADIEWEYKGYKYYANVEVIDGKWRGDIYKTNIKGGDTTIKIKNSEIENKPTNIMEDIHGTRNIDDVEKGMWEDVKKYLSKKFELNSKGKGKEKGQAMEKVIRKVGETVKNKYNFKNIDEAVDFYKNKYGLEFDFKKDLQSERSFGETRKYIKDGELIKAEIYIDKNIADDIDMALGVLRHEIEHLRDYKNNPNFKSKPYNFASMNAEEGILEYMDKATKGHFSGDNNSWWELNYLISNEIDSIFSNGKVNKVSLERLGLDMIPKELDKGDIEYIADVIKSSEGEEAVKRLKSLKTRLSNYFTIKRGLKDILNSSYEPGTKTGLAKEYLRTNILLPFQNAEEQMKNSILKAFEIDINGNKLNPEKVLDIFEENNINFVDVLFYGEKLPKELESISSQIEGLKVTINKILDDLQEKSIASKDDIINTLCYDRNLTIERLIPNEEVLKYMDTNKNLDIEKITNGEQIKDNLTGKDIAEKILPFREKFAELNYKYFNSSIDRLHHELNRKKLNPQKIIKAIKEARECMSLEDFTKILKKYKVEEIPQVKKFLDENPKIFKEIKNQNIEKAIIESKKNNAKIFFTNDMTSLKGTEENAAFGTFAHKLSRFVDAEYEGYISHKNVSNFVKANKTDSRLAISKLIKDVSTAHAIKETFPKMGNTGFNVMFKTMQKESGNPYTKTFVKELEEFIKTEIGEKLGISTKPTRGGIDKFIQGFIKWQNKINLSGPKAIKELGQEPLGMARANVMLYGGKGFIETYKNIMKATAILAQHGEELSKYNSVLGSKWKDSVPLEFFNIIQDDLNDFTGYRKARLEKYGTRGEKLLAKMDNGLDLVNMYSHTQRMMKLASYMTAGDTMDKLTNFKNLDELFKNNNYVKRLFKDLEIDEREFELIKIFKETESFKNMGIFDEAEFFNNLTPEKYIEVLGREITDEEFKILSEATTKKAKRLYEKIVSDISPTETTGATKSVIENIEDPIRRNFMRLTGNFKNSIQEQWRRAVRDYYLSNINADTGKFDWGNKVYQKRMLSHILGTGMAVATISTISDSEFYADPIEYISEKIDNLVEEPGSALWGAISDNFNLWGLTTGSNVVRRPITFVGQVSKGEWGKAGSTLIKSGLGTTNYNIAKYIYDEMR